MPSLAELLLGQQKPPMQSQPGGLAGLMQSPIPGNDPSWYRPDGTKKGQGFLGMLPFHDGRTSSELSIGVNLNGKEMQIPSLVPTLSQQEIQHLLSGGLITDAIAQKAVDHARMRMQQGLPVFAE